jgi:hypothetical protein
VRKTNTCPQILETYGSNEFYDEKMAPDFTGADSCWWPTRRR